MSAEVFQNLRNVLTASLHDIASKSGISVEHLLAIEEGKKPPTETFLKTYSEILNIKIEILRIIFIGTDRKVCGFNAVRTTALRAFNEYLRFSLWLMAFNETEKEVPR